MSNPIALISNDWHLKRSNCEEIIQLIREQCQLAKQHGLDEIICLGDVFDSRISQRMDVLIAFYQILEVCKKEDVTLICIPGNHDKTDYTAEESFLRPFSFHPNLNLIECYSTFTRADYAFHFIPYFAEATHYPTYLEKVQYSKKNILFSHIAVQGSRNNDGTLIDNNLTPAAFSRFSAVLLGHYHDHQMIGANIYHLPSLKQDNYGEDDHKGYTLLYDDLSLKIIKSSSKSFYTIPIDLGVENLESIEAKIAGCDLDKAYYRLTLSGTKEQMKSLDVNALKERGFVVKNREKDISKHINALSETEIMKYDIDHIINLFKEFCDQRKISFEVGVKYLNATKNLAY